MRGDACEATSLRHEQSETLLDLRMQCLDRRFTELRTLTSLFARADGPLVDNAVAATSRLGDLGPCADARGLLGAAPLPDDLPTQIRITTVRDALTRAETVYNAGRYRASEDLLRPLVADARTIGYPPLLGEALLLLGMAQMVLYEDAAAQVTLDEAMLVLAAAHDDARVATTWLRLVNVIGVGLSGPVEGLALRQGAEAALLRAGNDRRQRALLDKNLASILRIQGKYDDALALQREALAIQLEVLGPDDPNIGNTRNSIGLSLMHQGKYDDALAQYTEALAFFQRVFGPEHPDVAGLLVNMGNVHARQGHPARAVEVLERALAIQEHTLGPDHPDLGTTLDNLGDARLAGGDAEGARRDVERANAIFEAHLPGDNLQIAESQRRLGVLWVLAGKPEAGRAAAARALAIYEAKLGSTHPSVADALDALGSALEALGKRDEAAAASRRALAIRAERSPPSYLPRVTPTPTRP